MRSTKLIGFLQLTVLLWLTSAASSYPSRSGFERQDQQNETQTVEQRITDGIRNNMIHSLSKLGSATEVTGTNVARSSALLIRSLVRETFNLGSVVAYIPRLLFLDGPNQFIETLRLIRSNQITAVPNDVNGAIDNLITYTGSVRDSGITGHLSPVVEFFPNVFTGVERWVKDVVYEALSFVGPLPAAATQDNVYAQEALRVVPTTQAPI